MLVAEKRITHSFIESVSNCIFIDCCTGFSTKEMMIELKWKVLKSRSINKLSLKTKPKSQRYPLRHEME